jgi:hypothetical protein
MPPGDLAPLIGVSVLAVCSAAVLILRGPLGRSLARWVDTWGENERLHHLAKGGAAGTDPARVDELEHRLLELEERLDFTERVLAQRGEPVRLREPRA